MVVLDAVVRLRSAALISALLCCACSGGAAPADGATPLDGGGVRTDGGPGVDSAVAPHDAGPPTAANTTISGWMDSCLPSWGNPSEPNRTAIIQAIIDACNAYGPPESLNPGWHMEYCWAHMIGAILAESSYNPMALAEPGSDPTVGLDQIRFSSVVCGYYEGGPHAPLEAMGCTFPSDFAAHTSEQCYMSSFWQTTGGDAAHTAFMETIPCNIGMGVWAYYLFASAGGDPTMTLYQYQICAGQGRPADLATGLCAYLMGPSSQFANITSLADVPAGAMNYVMNIKGVMDCALGTLDPHPLFIPLHPNPSQYCQ